MPVKGSKRRARIEIRSALHGVGLAKDIIVATPEEIAMYQGVVGTLVRPALREGMVLYERPA